MLDPSRYKNVALADRSCGSCTLCCKVYDVPVLDKPAGQWCKHCVTGRGCAIHATRPEHCRAFFCLWMTQATLGPEWKPDRSKLVLSVDPDTRFLLVQVDPGNAGAWRRDPYYPQLKDWARGAVADRRLVVVFLNKSATVVLPDRDVPIGIMGPGDRIVARENRTESGVTIDVRKVSPA